MKQPGFNPNNTEQTKPALEDLKLWKSKNFYQRLGVSTSATNDEIKKAFRSISIKYHPDKVQGFNDDNLHKNYLEVFQFISEAYNELSDSHKRSKYDAKSYINRNSQNTGSSPSYQRPPHTWSQAKDAYANSQQGYQEPKKEFNEVEEIKNIASYVKQNISNPYELPRIKKLMDDFIRRGGKKENLINETEKIFVDYFVIYTKQNISNPYELPRIKKLMDDFDELGINRNKLLLSIKATLVGHMQFYTKQNISNPYELPRIKKLMKDFQDFGIEKNDFVAVIEDTVIEYFTRYAKSNINNQYEIPRIKKLLNDLPELGIAKNKLLESIENLTITYFESYVKKNFNNQYEIPRIKKFRVDLIDLGIDLNKLNEIVQRYNII